MSKRRAEPVESRAWPSNATLRAARWLGMLRRLGVVAVAALVVASMATPITFARLARSYGEMVDYPLTFPVDGAVELRDTFYAARSDGDHHAQDLMAPKLTPVVAAASGTVRYVNWSRDAADPNPERCCTMVIRHDDGWESWYIHLNNDTPGTDDGQGWGIYDGIEVGARVDAGQQIGWVGDSGNAESTPPHLHFELFDPNGVVVNPYESLLAVCDSRCTTTGAASIPRTPAGPNDILVQGSFGDVVQSVQAGLAAAGFDPGPIDGIFGAKTHAAVIAFQEAAGILVDGKVGPQTKATLAGWDPGADTGSDSGEDADEDAGQEASAPAPQPEAPVVAYGAYGSAVFDLQRMLTSLGHDPGPVDGAFGPMTKAGVQRFQRSSGLTDSGTVDRATWDALVTAASGESVTVVVPYGSRGDKVFELQSRLDGRGHDPGPIDGIFGPMTKAAVASFQQATDLSIDGVVDQPTWDALVG